MNNFFPRIAFAVLVFALSAFGQQNTLRNTTLSAAISTDRQTVISLTSITNVVAGTMLYVDQEAMMVLTTPTAAASVSVRRGASFTAAVAHASGALVLHGPPQWFQSSDPLGTCTASTIYVTPWLNVRTGNQWLCSSVTSSWVPGFGNRSAAMAPTAAVASAAGLITPSGPLFHITGTAAVTGFNIPLGFTSGQICAIPDGLFTTTNANNFAIATTAVVSKLLCWQYDSATAKFYPTY